jgi:hypothetical protein
MLKRIWWAIKVGLFPHLERRKERAQVLNNQRRSRRAMMRADSLLDTAILDLTNAIERKDK